MSWWTNLASKAEDFLNQVDQTAATALQEGTNAAPGTVGMDRFLGDTSTAGRGWKPVAEFKRPTEPQKMNAEKQGESAFYYGGPTRMNRDQVTSAQQKSQSARSMTSPTGLNKKDDESALLDFLNSSAAPKPKERPQSAMAKSSVASHSRQSSIGSTKSESVIDFQGYDDGYHDPPRYDRQSSDDVRSTYEDVIPVYPTVTSETGQETSNEPEPEMFQSQYAQLKSSFSSSDIAHASAMTSSVMLETEDDDVHDELSLGGVSPSVMLIDQPLMFQVPETSDTDSPATVIEDNGYVHVQENIPQDPMQTSVQNLFEEEPSVQSEASVTGTRQPTPPDIRDEEMEHLNQTVSELKLENKLLRSEVQALNSEIVGLVQREKTFHQDMMQQAERHQEIELKIREFESREQDFMESVRAKDHQIGVLRVRLEEVDNELAGKSQAIQILESERERILNDHHGSQNVQSQALENMRIKLYETENLLRREQDTLRQLQREAQDRQFTSEDERKNLAEQLQILHKRLLEEKNKNVEVTQQMRTEKQNTEAAKQELTDYKEKAARILQSKDKTIATLRDGGSDQTSRDSPSSPNSAEHEQVKEERDMYKEELQIMSMNVERMRQEITDLESQLHSEQEQSRDTIAGLEEQYNSEKQRREESDMELMKVNQELRYAHEEMLQQRLNLQKLISDKESEIERLSSQLASKMTNTTSQAELENRLRALTESLIQKQTLLENISTEKASLALQLERTERHYHDNQRTQAATARINITPETEMMAKSRLPSFMETCNDTHVTRGMKRAANTVDTFSIRLGLFLRRYPIARIFVIFYMFMVHLWVLVILLTNQPEMHSDDYGPMAPKIHHEH